MSPFWRNFIYDGIMRYRRYTKPSRMTWDQWDRLRRSRIRWFFYRLFTRC